MAVRVMMDSDGRLKKLRPSKILLRKVDGRARMTSWSFLAKHVNTNIIFHRWFPQGLLRLC